MERSAPLEMQSGAVNDTIAMLDCKSSELSRVIDSIAALSCEALKADVTSFSSTSLGDGKASKDEIAVATDMKMLLNGSKLAGKCNYEAVVCLPKIHGSFREQCRFLHHRARSQLSSGDFGSREVWGSIVSSLATALRSVGERSLNRAELNAESISCNFLKSFVSDELYRRCPTSDYLKSSLKTAYCSIIERDYIRSLLEINELLNVTWDIVAWELITAVVALECSDSTNNNQGDDCIDKRNDKKKKVLGIGTTLVMQFIKDKGKTVEQYPDGERGLLEKWVEIIFLFLNPEKVGFAEFSTRVREIVESNESRRLPKLPKGTRDFAKEQMIVREKAFSIIVQVFQRHGASALDTPVFELRETLTGKYGEDSKLIYDLADQGGELCSLRYDLTVPFARYIAMNGITSFKKYQIGKVYRRDNPSKGRYREFYQCDFDIAGSNGRMGPDSEVIKILTELLDELDIGDYEVKINHRQLLDGMLDICGVPTEKFRTICSSIDKMDKLSFSEIKREMVEDKGLCAETADKIGNFVKERGQPLELLEKLKQEGCKFLEHNGSSQALNDLEILFKALERSRCINKVVFDLSLARGLDYYTGVIFEAAIKGSMQVGSIAAGGRYDNLIGMFGTKQVPAVGVSLGIERVFTIMEQLHKTQSKVTCPSKTQVLVAILGDDIPLALELVSEFWDSKVAAEYMVNKRVMKHIEHARNCMIPWMIIVGERELNEGIVKLKDIEANKEEVVLRSRIVEEVHKRLGLCIDPGVDSLDL